MKKSFLILPVFATLVSCTHTTVVEPPKPTTVTRDSTTIRATSYEPIGGVSSSQTTTTTVQP